MIKAMLLLLIDCLAWPLIWGASCIGLLYFVRELWGIVDRVR
jgi:hypothetical protein